MWLHYRKSGTGGFKTNSLQLHQVRALCFVRVSEAVCCQLLLPRLCVVMSFYLSGTEKTK